MKQSHIIWLFIGFLFFGFLYISWGIFTPFVVSLVIAYLWSPVISFIEKQWKIPRWIISLWLVLVTVGILLSIIILLLPLIYNQILDFIQLAPHYKRFIDQKIIPIVVEKFGTIAPEYTSHIKVSIAELFASSFNSIVIFLKRIWSSGFVVMDLLWFMLLVPFITFHLMKDWKKLLFYIKNAIPIEKQKVVQKFFSDTDSMIASVIRGQFNVCMIWSIYYTAALSLIGLDHSVLLGITTGLVNFIPFVGFIIAFAAVLIVAYLQFTSMKYIILVMIIYCFALLFDNGFLSPRLIGKRVGMHSVWSIFSILLGGKLFGFVGMLIAIPIGATIMLLLKMILKYYYKSDLYITKKAKAKVKVNV